MNTITNDQDKMLIKIAAKNKVSYSVLYNFFIWEANDVQISEIVTTANDYVAYINEMKMNNYISIHQFEVVKTTDKAILISSVMPKFEKWIPKSQMFDSFFPTWTLQNN